MVSPLALAVAIVVAASGEFKEKTKKKEKMVGQTAIPTKLSDADLSTG